MTDRYAERIVIDHDRDINLVNSIPVSPMITKAPSRTNRSSNLIKSIHRSYSISDQMWNSTIAVSSQSAHFSPSNAIEPEKSNSYDRSSAIPADYLTPNASLPSRDLYLQNIKRRYFTLGVIFGASMQMFFVSFLIMFLSTMGNAGPIKELSHEYYPVFRGVFLVYEPLFIPFSKF